MSEPQTASVSEVIGKLSAAFERDKLINVHRHPLKVRAADGRLILEGQVEDVAAWRRAQGLAGQIVNGQWQIESRLRRATPEPMGERQLRDEVMQRLSTEPVFSRYSLRAHTENKFETLHDGGPDAYEIEVHIAQGKVTLNGVVESLSHRRLAEALIWWSRGCETVDNQLEINPPQDDSDDEITDAVRIILEKDPLVHAEQLRVGTAGGVVHLDGLVSREAERRAAVLDAWTVDGVWDVADRIEVGS